MPWCTLTTSGTRWGGQRVHGDRRGRLGRAAARVRKCRGRARHAAGARLRGPGRAGDRTRRHVRRGAPPGRRVRLDTRLRPVPVRPRGAGGGARPGRDRGAAGQHRRGRRRGTPRRRLRDGPYRGPCERRGVRPSGRGPGRGGAASGSGSGRAVPGRTGKGAGAVAGADHGRARRRRAARPDREPRALRPTAPRSGRGRAGPPDDAERAAVRSRAADRRAGPAGGLRPRPAPGRPGGHRRTPAQGPVRTAACHSGRAGSAGHEHARR